MEKQEKNTATPYDLDGRPPLKLAIPLGLQHVLAMFVGNLTPLLIFTAARRNRAGWRFTGSASAECYAHCRYCNLPCRYLCHRASRRSASNRYGNKFRFRCASCQSVAGVMGNGVVAYGAIVRRHPLWVVSIETVLGKLS